MKIISSICIKLVVLAIVLNVNTSFSQENKVLKTADSTNVEKPKLIPTINIIDQIEEAKESIKTAYKTLEQKGVIIEIDSLLPPYSNFIRDQKKSTENFIKAHPNRLKVNILLKKWSGYIDFLNDWQNTINKHAKKNTALADKVSFNKKTWELTYDNAKEKKIPIEILKSVNLVLNEITKLEATISTENNALLKLESKVSLQIVDSKDVIVQLNELKNSEVYDLLYLRHDPIWKFSFEPNEDEKIRKENSESLSKNLTDLIKLIKTSEENLNLYLIIVACIALIILYLKRQLLKSKIYDTSSETVKAKNNLQNFSLSIILFLSFLAAKYTFINTPKLFDDTLSLLALLIITPLIQSNIRELYKKVLFFVVLFYFIDLTKTYLWLTIGQYKLYLLLMAVFVFITTYLIIPTPKKAKSLNIGYFSRYIIKAAPILYILCSISIISNILGYTNLTETTLKICTRSGVIVMIFYYLLLITKSATILIVHKHYSKKEVSSTKTKRKILKRAFKTIRIVMVGLGIILFLKMVDVFQYINQFLNDVLTEAYTVGDVTFTIGSILSFLLILTVSYIITKLISFAFGDDTTLFNIISLPKGVPAAISLVIRYFIFAFGIMLALSSLGIDLSKFNLMAGALGLGIGFGLQTVISNFVSGLILVFERPILPGDTVEVDNLLGTVNRIGVRSSNISTFDGAEVVVPNNNLISNNLINWTLSDSIKRLEIKIGTTYNANPNKVLKILSEAALENDTVLKSPPPLPLLNDFGEYSLNFKLRFWVHNENGLSARSNVSISIYNKFKEHGIEIPFPQQDIHLKSMPHSSSKPKDSNKFQ